MARRKKHHRRRAKRNPGAAIATALTWLGGGAIIGAAGGALTNASNRAQGSLAGAESGIAVVAIVGGIVGLVNPKHQAGGFATAALGLGGLVVLGLTMNLLSPSSTGVGRPGLGARPGVNPPLPFMPPTPKLLPLST